VGKETPLPPRAWKGEEACLCMAASYYAGSPAFHRGGRRFDLGWHPLGWRRVEEDTMRSLDELLAEAEVMHGGHTCPGQVLGVRMAMRACRELGIEEPGQDTKRLMVFVEIDRCAADAIAAVTGCRLGKRTLKHVDYGKMAATFLDTQTGQAVRVLALEESRDQAWRYARPGMS
jgi:hypothetical protein